jgi:hypothetical protein
MRESDKHNADHHTTDDTLLALKEEVQFNQSNVTSLDWNTYQTLRFGDHPAVTPIVVQQINEKSSGRARKSCPRWLRRSETRSSMRRV